jgi:formamidopyrimidine-DNA glycosylase
MPELPEVETFRRYFEETSLNQKVTDIQIAEKSEKLFKTPPKQFIDTIKGNQFTGSTRIGKYLLVHLQKNGYMVVHFGMTGDFSYFKKEETPPKRAKIFFYFDNCFCLTYNSRRKFGWVDLAEDIAAYQKDKKLGPDALDIEDNYLYERLKKSTAPIKARLLDQKILAGIGNWVADEVLYQSKIHPATTCDKLEASDYQRMQEKIEHVLKVSIEKEADWDSFPDHFMVKQREKKGRCPETGEKLEITEVGGRTTYLCPVLQKRP